MRSVLLTRITFIGKSLLWSLLLYMTAMLVVNWDDIIHHRKMNNIVAVSSPGTTPVVVPSASSTVGARSSILCFLGAIRTATHQINKAAHFPMEN